MQFVVRTQEIVWMQLNFTGILPYRTSNHICYSIIDYYRERIESVLKHSYTYGATV
jgi:hypothetical protein